MTMTNDNDTVIRELKRTRLYFCGAYIGDRMQELEQQRATMERERNEFRQLNTIYEDALKDKNDTLRIMEATIKDQQERINRMEEVIHTQHKMINRFESCDGTKPDPNADKCTDKEACPEPAMISVTLNVDGEITPQVRTACARIVQLLHMVGASS